LATFLPPVANEDTQSAQSRFVMPVVLRNRNPKTNSHLAIIWPALLLCYAVILPVEMSLNLSALHIGAYRLVLLLLSPVLFNAIVKGRYKPHWADGLMLIVSLWLPVSFWVNYDFSVGLEAGFSQAIDVLFAYLVGRIFIKDFATFKSLLAYMLPGLAAVALLLIGESVIGKLFVRETAASIFGGAADSAGLLKYEFRLGLLRATGPFPNPIHAGVFLTSYILLYIVYFTAGFKRIVGVIVSIAGVFSISSAAVMLLGLSAILSLYNQFMAYFKEINWRVSLVFVICIMGIVQVFSKNGVVPILYRYLTFNPATGYFRTLIWEQSTDDVWRNPWFGIGYEEYTRPAWMVATTIDAHYLAMAVKYGLVPALLYFLIALAVIFMIGNQSRRLHGMRASKVLLGMAISMSTLLLVMFTVTFWGSILSWFNMLLGAFLSIAISASTVKKTV
jgi:hypothetical protein